MADWLRDKFPAHVEVDRMLATERFVYDDARPVGLADAYRPNTFVWFHRDLREEVEVPGTIHIIHRDERLVVIDKPPFLSTIPRGQHVLQSVVVKLRDELDLPELSSLHRLDRITSGVLMLATERQWRGPYQTLFEQRAVAKQYQALAGWRADLRLPLTVRNHIRKTRGQWQAEVIEGAPANAETLVEFDRRVAQTEGENELAVYRLTPRTGKTHQLRLHLHGLGIAILNDPLYPVVRETSVEDFSRPLQLLASEVSFTDPIDQTPRRFRSVRSLPIAPGPSQS